MSEVKIIDTFLFSEPYESDLLYVKFQLEKNHIHKWVIQESAYSLKGDFKGLHAVEVLSEPRFKEFGDRVIVLSCSDRYGPESQNEGDNFVRENFQRTYCLEYLKSLDYENTYVLVSDTDEAIDFSSEERSQRFFSSLNQNYPVWIGRMRYWYDYDNRCYLPNIYIPVCPLSTILANPQFIMQLRHNRMDQLSIPAGENPIAFEYSYVFRNIDALYRKKQTYSHTGFTIKSLEDGLKCNHWPRPVERGERLGANKYDFFEHVELTETNSPKFVRDNLHWLKTNVVDINYKENRLKEGIIL